MRWTQAELDAVRAAYEGATVNAELDLDALSASLGRPKTSICRKARGLGLTDQKRPGVVQRKPTKKYATLAEAHAAVGQATKERFANGGHPRGALGMRHTDAAKRAQSERTKAAWADPAHPFNSPDARQKKSDALLERIKAGEMRPGYSRTKGGKRKDLGGQYFRSAWEANYARWLTYLKARGEIASWDYECKTFVFEEIKRGTRSYTPDFLVVENSGAHSWHEVKGWMDAKSKTRLKRMAKYFPSERVIVFDAAWFRSANRTIAGLIPRWESGTTR